MPSGVGNSIAGYLHLVAVSILFADSLQEGADSYGGYPLQRGDSDALRRWGGAAAVDAANPPPGSHVRQLQDDLSELGFRSSPTTLAGVFGRNTEWAVRELQVYATMRHLAIQTRPPTRATSPASNRRSTSTTTPARSRASSTSTRGS